MKKKHLIAAALVCSLAGVACAEGDAQAAYSGVAADAATTAIGLGLPGIAEANPLGWATVPIRLAVIQHAKTLPREEGQPLMDAVSAGGWGAAANNLLVLLGAGPIGPVVGLAVGYAVWKAGEPEREFWQACAVHKADNPAIQCEFKPMMTAMPRQPANVAEAAPALPSVVKVSQSSMGASAE